MNGHKYVALDVDSANIVAGVFDCKGEQVMEAHIRPFHIALMTGMTGIDEAQSDSRYISAKS